MSTVSTKLVRQTLFGRLSDSDQRRGICTKMQNHWYMIFTSSASCIPNLQYPSTGRRTPVASWMAEALACEMCVERLMKIGNHRPGPWWPLKLISLGRVDWCFKVGISKVISWNICYQTIRSCVSGIHWIQCRGLPWCKVRIQTHLTYLLASFLAELGKKKFSWGYHTNLPAGSTS